MIGKAKIERKAGEEGLGRFYWETWDPSTTDTRERGGQESSRSQWDFTLRLLRFAQKPNNGGKVSRPTFLEIMEEREKTRVRPIFYEKRDGRVQNMKKQGKRKRAYGGGHRRYPQTKKRMVKKKKKTLCGCGTKRSLGGKVKILIQGRKKQRKVEWQK